MNGLDKRHYRLMYAGLAFSVFAQLAVVAMWADGQLDDLFFPVGNVVTALVTLGAIWFIRQRQKGRL